MGDWPLVIVKELVDNAPDAAEEAGTAPSIEIVVTDNSITVGDRGRGVAPDTVASLIDYSVRTSSRAAYVSSTRGAQGAAMQSIFPMGFALASLPSDFEALFDALGDTAELMDAASMADIAEAAQGGERGALGEVLIESQGVAHRIVFAVDPVRQTPDVSQASEPSEVKNGARITVRWPNSAKMRAVAGKHGRRPWAPRTCPRNDIAELAVAERVDDGDVMRLLKVMLKANGKQGVPQGGVISPLLSNLYLTEVDRRLERAKEATRYGIIAGAKSDFLQLVSTFACLNPHLTLSAEWRASDPPLRLRRGATLYMDDGSCCDMSAGIALFEFDRSGRRQDFRLGPASSAIRSTCRKFSVATSLARSSGWATCGL